MLVDLTLRKHCRHIKYNSEYNIEFKEIQKLKDKLNKEKEIKQVSYKEIEEKAYNIRKGLA